MTDRTQEIQDFLDTVRNTFKIPDHIIVTSDHPRACRCTMCLRWWADLGAPEEEYGPFTREEVEDYVKQEKAKAQDVSGKTTPDP